MANVKVMVDTKSLAESKTVWLNTVVLVLSIAFAVSRGLGLIEEVPNDYAGYVTAAIAIGNVILRIFFTQGPIVVR